MARKAIIIGAGPAGLTAAYELLTRTDIKPIIIEADKQVGGLSKTINHQGNLMDIGGHRFFSKSGKVISWWLKMLPLENDTHRHAIQLNYQRKTATIPATRATADGDRIMLVRPRKSRIYFEGNFFDYPLQPTFDTVRKLGFLKVARIGFSFIAARLFPDKPEDNLAKFFKNRFGDELYSTFFKDYTEKVWGVPCEQLPASWGYQRVKDLNFSKAFFQSVKSIFIPNHTLKQEGLSPSLIEQFLYPKYGPGQMWETVRDKVLAAGGEILLNKKVTRLFTTPGNITALEYTDTATGEKQRIEGDFFFSSMPVKDFVIAVEDPLKKSDIIKTAKGLEYRNFIIAGLLVNHKLSRKNELLKDNWIYLQDKQVRAGRLQIFNNWSDSMVKDPETTWLGMEYFCNEGDELWKKPKEEIAALAIDEIVRIGLIRSKNEITSFTVEKIDKAYPAYTGSYNRFHELNAYTDQFRNLFLVGRNGMHRYNNTDHSMITAMTAVDNIIAGNESKNNIWDINLEEVYHEEH